MVYGNSVLDYGRVGTVRSRFVPTAPSRLRQNLRAADCTVPKRYRTFWTASTNNRRQKSATFKPTILSHTKQKHRHWRCPVLVGEGGFASRALKNSPPDCFLLSAESRAVLISTSKPKIKKAPTLRWYLSNLVGEGGFEPPKLKSSRFTV